MPEALKLAIGLGVMLVGIGTGTVTLILLLRQARRSKRINENLVATLDKSKSSLLSLSDAVDKAMESLDRAIETAKLATEAVEEQNQSECSLDDC